MRLSLNNRRIWIPVLACLILVVISLVIIQKNKLGIPTREMSMSMPLAYVPDQPPQQNNQSQIAPDSKSDSAEKVKSDLIRQLQPEAEKFAAEQKSTENNTNTHPSNLTGEIISRAYQGKTDEEKIEILKSYLTNPNLTEQDLYEIHRQMAQWLIGVKDYEAASAIYDEQEAHWEDNPAKLLELKMARAGLDYAKGDRESAIQKLTEIVSLPVPEDRAEFAQVLMILFMAPSQLASYYKEEGNVDGALNLLWEKIERTIEWDSKHPESIPLGGAIVTQLNSVNSFELDDARISPEEARKRLDDMVQRLIKIRPEYSKRWSYLGTSVGIGYGVIDRYKNRINAE